MKHDWHLSSSWTLLCRASSIFSDVHFHYSPWYPYISLELIAFKYRIPYRTFLEGWSVLFLCIRRRWCLNSSRAKGNERRRRKTGSIVNDLYKMVRHTRMPAFLLFRAGPVIWLNWRWKVILRRNDGRSHAWTALLSVDDHAAILLIGASSSFFALRTTCATRFFFTI